MIHLENEIAIVTGSSRGIGADIAKSLAANGCKVAVNYRQSEDKANAVVEEIRRAGGTAVSVKADVTDKDQVNRMAETVAGQFGHPTILVNNASSSMIAKKIAKTEWGEFESCFAMAVKSAFNCCGAVTPQMMKNRRGKIVNIVTQYSMGAPPIAMATYVTAKHALVGFSKSLAVELAPFGIQVNMVSPGFTETELVGHVPESFRQSIAGQTPLKRNALASDTSNAVLYLVSGLSNFVTGINLPVCGGNVM
ncbi:MAG: SDR family oxidoreductase [Nitrospinae bacterium]|nr:SDR family oxidoreductase [Nitrospinota bacterium]